VGFGSYLHSFLPRDERLSDQISIRNVFDDFIDIGKTLNIKTLTRSVFKSKDERPSIPFSGIKITSSPVRSATIHTLEKKSSFSTPKKTLSSSSFSLSDAFSAKTPTSLKSKESDTSDSYYIEDRIHSKEHSPSPPVSKDQLKVLDLTTLETPKSTNSKTEIVTKAKHSKRDSDNRNRSGSLNKSSPRTKKKNRIREKGISKTQRERSKSPFTVDQVDLVVRHILPHAEEIVYYSKLNEEESE